MQVSPQDIKTRLDRAVDSEGNVLDMAAVLEIVTTLERFPITKEALETTRIGKTINLLRKKTDNEGLAKRAKKLVKKWQTLVINHIQTTRNPESPLNGSQVSSPQINGAIRNIDKCGTPTLTERTDKPRILEGKKRGAKRKRDGSSSDNSPIMFSQSSHDSSRCNTPRSTYSSSSAPTSAPNSNASLQDIPSSSKTNNKQTCSALPEHSSDNLESCSQKGTDIVSDIPDGTASSSVPVKNSDTVCEDNNDSKHAIAAIETDKTVGNCETTSNENSTSMETGDTSELEKVVAPNIENEASANVQSVDICDSELVKNEHINVDAPPSKKQKLDTTDSPPCHATPSSLLPHACDKLPDATPEKDCHMPDTINSTCEKHALPERGPTIVEAEQPETMEEDLDEGPPPEPKEHVLDLNEKADGVNGRYGDDGQWYDWTEVMPYNEGSLSILPYVLLE